jgi:hypothetical protein
VDLDKVGYGEEWVTESWVWVQMKLGVSTPSTMTAMWVYKCSRLQYSMGTCYMFKVNAHCQYVHLQNSTTMGITPLSIYKVEMHRVHGYIAYNICSSVAHTIQYFTNHT